MTTHAGKRRADTAAPYEPPDDHSIARWENEIYPVRQNFILQEWTDGAAIEADEIDELEVEF